MFYFLLGFLVCALALGPTLYFVGRRDGLKRYAEDIMAAIKRHDVAEERAREFGYRMERKPIDRRRPE